MLRKDGPIFQYRSGLGLRQVEDAGLDDTASEPRPQHLPAAVSTSIREDDEAYSAGVPLLCPQSQGQKDKLTAAERRVRPQPPR